MAINQAATVSTANGIAKRVHGGVQNLVPGNKQKFLNRVKYDSSTSLGGEFEELVWLTTEHGFTYAGTSGAKKTLRKSEVAETQPAKGNPSSIHFRSEVVIELMSRASEKGEKAFESYIAAMMRESKKAFSKRLECTMLYGGGAMATASSVSSVDATHALITISNKTWAPWMWLNMRNCGLDGYVTTTQQNTNADLNITKVDIKNKQLTVVGNSTDITAVVAAGSTLDLYFAGQYGNDCSGLRTVANLTTGSYLSITADTYPDVWNGSQIDWDYSTTQFSWGVLQDGLEQAASRGAEGDLICQVPLTAWSTLNNSLDALRVLDSSYKVSSVEMGHSTDAITYHGVTGKVTVEPSGYQRYGEVMCYLDPAEDKSMCRRIGSSDITFNTPGRGDEMFRLVEDSNTVEYRAFTDQIFWMPAPRNAILFTH